MLFSQIERRSLSAENRAMHFVSLPSGIPAAIEQKILETRAAKLGPEFRRVPDAQATPDDLSSRLSGARLF